MCQLDVSPVFFSIPDYRKRPANQKQFLSPSRIHKNSRVRVLSQILELPRPIVSYDVWRTIMPHIGDRHDVWLAPLRSCCEPAQLVLFQELNLLLREPNFRSGLFQSRTSLFESTLDFKVCARELSHVNSFLSNRGWPSAAV